MIRGDENCITQAYDSCLKAGVTLPQLREVIVTCYLFDGYPTALEGFRILHEIEPPSANDGSTFYYSPENINLWRKRGVELCMQVYEAQYNPLMDSVSIIAPELKDAMIVEGYGKILSRDGLDIKLRELCISSILAVKNKPRQLLSHAKGSLRFKATPSQLRLALHEADRFLNEASRREMSIIIEKAIKSMNLPN